MLVSACGTWCRPPCVRSWSEWGIWVGIEFVSWLVAVHEAIEVACTYLHRAAGVCVLGWADVMGVER